MVRLRVRNYLDAFRTTTHRETAPENKGYVVVHRNSLGSTPAELMEAYRGDAGRHTRNEWPYNAFIPTTGELWIAKEITEIGAAARGFNTSGWNVALEGDFRKHAPTQSQLETLQTIAAMLGAWYELPARKFLLGHTERAGASRDPDKVCPGHMLDMSKLRADVQQEMDRCALSSFEAELDLLSAGLVF